MNEFADLDGKNEIHHSKKKQKLIELRKQKHLNFNIPTPQKDLFLNSGQPLKFLNSEKASFIQQPLTPKDSKNKENIIPDLKNEIEELNNRQQLINEQITIKEYYSKGGSSNCFLCVCKKYPHKLFIMKSIENSSNLTKNLDKEHFLHHIKNEFHIQKISRCRYVTAVNGIFQIDSKFLIFSEFEIYGDLANFKKKYLRTDTLSESLAIYFGGMVLKGLEHLHKLKISHFDIKLENILINGFFNAKICDFSISKDYSNLTKIKLNSSGTQRYLSPEQFEKKEIDIQHIEKIDLWALGVVFYKMIYGKFPYNSKDKQNLNNIEYYNLIQNNDLEFYDTFEISVELIDLIKRLLEKDIDKRISLNEALSHPIMARYQQLQSLKNEFSDFRKFIDVLRKEVF